MVDPIQFLEGFRHLSQTDWLNAVGVSMIEIPMSFDNGLMMLSVTAALEAKVRPSAIAVGMLGAWVLRIGGLFVAGWLLALPFVLLLAGAYLMHLPAAFFTQKSHHEQKAATGFWPAVFTMWGVNLAFSVDNYGGAFALTSSTHVIFIAISVAMIALSLAVFFAQGLLTRFPALEPTAYILVGVAALLIFYEEVPGLFGYHEVPELHQLVKVGSIAVSLFASYFLIAKGVKLGWFTRPVRVFLEWYEATWSLPVRIWTALMQVPQPSPENVAEQ